MTGNNGYRRRRKKTGGIPAPVVTVFQNPKPEPYRALAASKVFWMFLVPLFLGMIGGTCTAAVWVVQSLDQHGDKIIAIEAREVSVRTLQDDIRELRREVILLRRDISRGIFVPADDELQPKG